jgi:hypothetical protein
MYFDPGETCVSKKADEVLSIYEIVELIDRHVNGDYGEIGTIDTMRKDILNGVVDWNYTHAQNMSRDRKNSIEIMFLHGYDIVSLYSVRGYKVFVITDSNREYTRVLLYDEY